MPLLVLLLENIDLIGLFLGLLDLLPGLELLLLEESDSVGQRLALFFQLPLISLQHEHGLFFRPLPRETRPPLLFPGALRSQAQVQQPRVRVLEVLFSDLAHRGVFYLKLYKPHRYA